jgi:tetratricopeptide (TPR) repeat protein
MNGVIKGNAGEVYFHKKQYTKSIEFYLENLSVAIQYDRKPSVIQILLSLSEAYIEKNDFSLAEVKLERAFDLMTENRIFNKKPWAYLLYKKIRLKQNRLKEAIRYQDLYSSYNDSLYNNRIIQKHSDAKAFYLMADVKSKVKLQRTLLKNVDLEKQRSELKLKSRTNLFIFIIGGAVLSLVILLLLIRAKINQTRNAHQKISFHKRELRTLTKAIANKNELIKKFESSSVDSPKSKKLIDDLKDSKILTSDDWNKFQEHLDIIYPGILLKLKDSYPEITNAESRLFILIKLGLRSSDLSNMLGISLDSVKKSRQRLRKRLEIDSSVVLEDFISNTC